ncbi:histidine kinase [Sphingobium phenoxybenzoativorans]|uniref:Histidine kinase n=1 Tax=Sphingobium phenoxybenzoativorans TaxID=1592790 RepID=A0A975PZT0_9SPHN|nr:histidine kinase [Sphingobium phenoxybenzoativorans]QUT04134.1 histidine kinase [Sphingobium phenoxybenzoativorans]
MTENIPLTVKGRPFRLLDALDGAGNIADMSGSREDARPLEAVQLTVALWLFVAVIYLPVLIDRHNGEGWRSIGLDASTVFVSMIFATPLFLVFRNTIGLSLRYRALILGGMVVLTAIVQTAFDIMFTGWVANNVERAWYALPRDLSRAYGAAFNYICVFSVNLALFQLSFARRREFSQSRKLVDAQFAAQQAQLAALRFQLNPHFLLNTLNAISSMIVTNRNAEAEKMTEKLSGFLRASLASDPTELVPLEDEFGLIEEYLDIEKVRFEERLTIDIACTDEAAAIWVPSFLLQPLVENAVKYGVGRSSEPVTVKIDGRVSGGQLVITVEDDGRFSGDGGPTVGASVGLNNVRHRLEAVYGKRSSLTARALDRGFLAAIHIPI